MPQAGLEPPLVDDTSYEADALPTVDVCKIFAIQFSHFHILQREIV